MSKPPSIAELNAHYAKTSARIRAEQQDIKAAQAVVAAGKAAEVARVEEAASEDAIKRGQEATKKQEKKDKDAEKARRAEVIDAQKVPEAEAEKAQEKNGGPLMDAANVGWKPGA